MDIDSQKIRISGGIDFLLAIHFLLVNLAKVSCVRVFNKQLLSIKPQMGGLVIFAFCPFPLPCPCQNFQNMKFEVQV